MSLFKKAGEKFEETKQAYLGGSSDPAYVCTSCEEAVSEDHEHCPHCGEATVEPVE